AAIEAASPSPWSSRQITAEHTRTGGIILVAQSSSHGVLGWCCAHCVGPEAELLKIAVDPGHRRKGLAESLLHELFLRCRERGVEEIFLEVRSQNRTALSLYHKLGWQETGRRDGYYQKPADDAIVYRRKL
ncbi:MAG: ribosomal protein S18-alanine N-acetyltransferase, partial [Thermodesulfobacteriota bacterium]